MTTNVQPAPSAQTNPDLASFMYGYPEVVSAQYYKEIEAMRTGTWTSNSGKTFTIDIDTLNAIVQNFTDRVAEQDIPIDIDHRFEEAAGWLIGARVLNDRLMLAPNWNDHGMHLVGSKQYRYVSCTIDMAKKLLLSLTLTNFPGVKGLAPLEFSQPPDGAPATIYEFQETSMTENTPGADGNPTPAATPPTTPSPAPQPTGESTGLAAFRTELTTIARQEIAQFGKQLHDEMIGFNTDFQKERSTILAQAVAEVRAERELVAFAERITSTGKFALPFKPTELLATLSEFPPAQRSKVQALLETISTSGLVDFSETGTSQGKKPTSTQPVPPAISKLIAEFCADSGTVDEFFALNPELGSKDQYDLSAYTK